MLHRYLLIIALPVGEFTKIGKECVRRVESGGHGVGIERANAKDDAPPKDHNTRLIGGTPIMFVTLLNSAPTAVERES